MTNDATEQDVTKRLTKAFSEALAAPRSDPWVVIDPEHLSEAIDHMEWIEKGVEEWRQMYVAESLRYTTEAAISRVAIRRLIDMLRINRIPLDADTAARDWLTSIGIQV